MFHLLAGSLEKFSLLTALLIVAAAKPRTLALQEAVVERLVLHLLALLLFPLAFSVAHLLQTALPVSAFPCEVFHSLAPKRLERVLFTPLSVRLDAPALVLPLYEVAQFLPRTCY